MVDRIPKKINDTIAYSVLELRFELSIDPKTLLSHVVPLFTQDYPTFESINQEVPPILREHNDQFKYMPEFRFSNDKFLIAIGKNVVQVEFIKEYESWENFGSVIKDTLKKILELGIVKRITRIGLRYSNIIKDVPFKDVVDYTFDLPFQSDADLSLNNINNRYEFESEEIKVNLLFVSNAEFVRKLANVKLKGLLIDVDVYRDHNLSNELGDTMKIIEMLHEKEKYVFFNSLKQEFVDSRKPQYD